MPTIWRIPSLVPPSSAVPTATEKQQYDDDDDQKGCVVHIVLLRGYGDDRTAEYDVSGVFCHRVKYAHAQRVADAQICEPVTVELLYA
jgi:hypothetical protein